MNCSLHQTNSGYQALYLPGEKLYFTHYLLKIPSPSPAIGLEGPLDTYPELLLLRRHIIEKWNERSSDLKSKLSIAAEILACREGPMLRDLMISLIT